MDVEIPSPDCLADESALRSRAYALGARFLLEGPTRSNVEALALLADPSALPAFDEAAMERFLERSVISCSAGYVPLAEQALQRARQVGGAWRFASMTGAYSRQIAAIYAAFGFDYRKLCGQECITRSLRPDSLAAECAFMAALLQDSDCSRNQCFADEFLRQHIGRWAEKASDVCAADEPDWLAASTDYIAQLVRSDLVSCQAASNDGMIA